MNSVYPKEASEFRRPSDVPIPNKDKDKRMDAEDGLLKSFWTKLVNKFWKSSVLKLCLKDVLVWLVAFNALSALYHYGLDENQAKYFAQMVKFCDLYLPMSSLPFLLGFYLTIIANRWWQQYLTIPWPDRVMLTLGMYCGAPKDERAKLLRRVLMRRCLLMLVLLFRHVSEAVQERFPSLDDLVNYGLMSPVEKIYFDNIVADINLFWVPGAWFVAALQDGVQEGIITDNEGTKLIMEGFLEFRSKCGLLWSYNWISIPKVYSQVVSLAAYSYFIACLMARQCIDSPSSICHVDRFFPVWTVLQFFCFMGLLKVAEQMENPWGDDDEDFDLNFLIDRHIKALRLDIDYLGDNYPPLRDDSLPTAKTVLPVPRVKFTSSITKKY